MHRWCSQEVLGLLGHQKTKQTVEYVECGAYREEVGWKVDFTVSVLSQGANVLERQYLRPCKGR